MSYYNGSSYTFSWTGRQLTGATKGGITKQDLCALGLSGGKDSAQKRKILLAKLELPEHMSANALLQALNIFYTLDELKEIVSQL